MRSRIVRPAQTRRAGGRKYTCAARLTLHRMGGTLAQLQANAASLPRALIQITGVIPFAQTIFLWQSGLIALVLIVISVLVAHYSAPSESKAVTARLMALNVEESHSELPAPQRPGEWLEYSSLLRLIIVVLGGGW